MRRLAYFCTDPGIPVFGTKGASVHVQEVVRSFRTAGWDVTVYCTLRGDTVPSDLADLRVIERRLPRGTFAESERATAETAAELARVAVADGFDLVYERYALFGRAGAIASAESGRQLVVEVNAPLIDEQRRHRVLVDAAGAHTATIELISAADVVACVSAPVADWVRDTVPGSRPLVVPNGVNLTRVTPGPEPSGPYTVGFVGTLKPWHGLDVLIEAFRRVDQPGWRLLVCGDGPERAALELRARKLKGAVEFTGGLPPDDVPGQLRRMHVATAPYPATQGERHYFSPLKLYEYLAAGLPVVASGIGQAAEVIEHGGTGLLVPPDDPVALADALRELADSRDLRLRMGARARARAVREHSWEAVVTRVLDAVDSADAGVMP